MIKRALPFVPQKWRIMLSLLLPACLLLLALPVESQSVQPEKGWGKVTDPEGDCKVTWEDGKVTIGVPGTYHDFWGEKAKGKVNGPRILQDAEGDFVVEVQVTGKIQPEKGTMIAGLKSGGPFQAASLLIWQDQDNFIRLDRCGSYYGGANNEYFYLQAFKDGKRAIDNDTKKAINVTAKGRVNQDSTLRLERKQGKVYPAYSQDHGKTWQSLPFKSITTDLPRKVQVGVGAVNNTTKGFTISFQNFQLTQKPQGK